MAISGATSIAKSSFLLDKLGKRRSCPEWLTIQEFPTCRGGHASTPFDGEGVRTRDMDIIRNGELMSWLLTSTPRPQAGPDHHGPCRVSITGRFQPPARTSRHAQEMGTGLLVTGADGAGVNIVNGDYSRGAAVSGLKMARSLIRWRRSAIAGGNLADMFSHIVAVGSDEDERSSLKTGSRTGRADETGGALIPPSDLDYGV